MTPIKIDQNAATLETSPAFEPISRVTLIVGTDENGDEVSYTAGDDTGRELTAKCPWATQVIADNLLAEISGYAYQPYAATDALLNPAAELGDAVRVGGVVSLLGSIETTFDALYTANIEAPQDEEIDHEYPYEASANREIKREAATITAQLRVDVDSITAEVAGIYAPEWASGTSYYKGSAVKIPATDGTATYYECIVAHTADAANKPPNATYWSVISAPSVASMVKVGLDGITLSASAGRNQSTVTISAGGIVIDSEIVQFSSIIADSVKASWVYAGDISADQITTGTLNAANIELRNYFDVIRTSGGVTSTIGRIGNASLTIDGVTYPGGMQLYGSTVAMLSGQSIAAVLASDEVWISSSTIYLNGDVRYTSDRNVKTDINYEDERLVALFDLIVPVSFKMKADPSIDHIGFVSQDVEAAAKDAGFVGALVTTDAEGRKYLGYNELTGALAAKIKQLDKRLYQLEVQNEQ